MGRKTHPLTCSVNGPAGAVNPALIVLVQLCQWGIATIWNLSDLTGLPDRDVREILDTLIEASLVRCLGRVSGMHPDYRVSEFYAPTRAANTELKLLGIEITIPKPYNLSGLARSFRTIGTKQKAYWISAHEIFVVEAASRLCRGLGMNSGIVSGAKRGASHPRPFLALSPAVMRGCFGWFPREQNETAAA